MPSVSDLNQAQLLRLSESNNFNVHGSILDQIMLEGDVWASSSAGNIANATITANQQVLSILLPSLSRAFWVEDVTISSNRQIDVQVQFGGNYANLIQTQRLIINPGIPVVLPVRQLIRPGLGTTTVAVGEVKI